MRVKPFLTSESGTSFDINLPFGSLRVIGYLEQVRPQGLVEYWLGNTHAHHYLAMWLRHLLFNCLVPEGIACMTRWLGENTAFTLRPVDGAEVHLRQLLEWYWQGLSRPLHLFPESALAYAQAVRQGSSDPLSKARQAAEEYDFDGRRAQAGYYQLAFRDSDRLDSAFTEVAEAVFMPLLDHVEEG